MQQASQVDMLVGDIYGERDYSSIGLSATTIASSFGKARRRSRFPLWHLSLAATAPEHVFCCGEKPLTLRCYIVYLHLGLARCRLP